MYARYAVRFFFRLPKFTAGILSYFKVNLGDMTENMQVDGIQRRMPVARRCCLNERTGIMTYKEEFIRFMVDSGVLTFGDFTLKSGRKAPYFINCGNYKTGAQLSRLGGFYADCIKENGIEVQTLFGPAYKGIPLAVTAVTSLADKYGIDCNYCFDRKEVKDHGEGGMFVGKTLTDGEKVVIIDDVMTSGKALRESLPKLKAAADVNVTAMVITVDRMEKSLEGELSAVEQAYKDFGVKVYSIVNINDIIKAIEDGVVEGKEYLDRMKAYRKEYGVG